MANPTTNYSFQMPTATDLVTDLPADFDVFGQAVDTRIKALNPNTTLGDLNYGSATANTNTRLPIGTTGQVLTVVGGVPAWSSEAGDISAVTAGTGISGGGTSGAVTITNDMATTITTNGDLLYGTGSGTYTRRGIGSTGQVLTVSGGVPTWATPAGGGKILQVVQATTTTSTTIASTTLTDTGITATITPTSATSKVLVMIASSSTQYRNSDSSYAGAKLLRGGTTISDWSTALFSGIAVTGGVTEVTLRHNQSIVYLDSPATTSATTYKLQSAVSTTAGSANINFQSGSSPSVIILMEVGA